jgi:hypothetical protein
MSRRRGVLAFAVLIAALLIGVWLVRQRGANDALIEVVPKPLSAPACGAAPQPLDTPLALELVVYRGADVDDARVQQQLGHLAAYYQAYGVRFARRGPVRQLAVDRVIAGDREAIDRALTAAGIEPLRRAADPVRARRIVCEVALAPLRAILSEQRDDGGDVHVVLLSQLAPADAMLAQLLPELRGLTLSPTTGDPDLRSCLAATEGFVPTVLIGLDAIAQRTSGSVDVTLAHEIGHVLGLAHNGRKNDLMAVEPPRCVPRLSDEQLAQLRPPAAR